jgi:hypothetical protein
MDRTYPPGGAFPISSRHPYSAHSHNQCPLYEYAAPWFERIVRPRKALLTKFRQFVNSTGGATRARLA